MKYIYLTSDKMKYRSIVARQTMFSETFPYFSFISFSITKSQHLESYLWFISHIINGRIINIYGKGLRKRHITNPPGNMYMRRSLLLHFVNIFTFHHLLSLWFFTNSIKIDILKFSSQGYEQGDAVCFWFLIFS